MSIPYALTLRRICSKSEKRVTDLSDSLSARGYSRRFVENQIGRVRHLTRVKAFRSKGRLRNGRTSFVVTYHPGLPNINKLLRDLHLVLESSERCKKAMGQVPVVAFRKLKSLAVYLVRAKRSRGRKEDTELGNCLCGSRKCEVFLYLDERDHFLSYFSDRKKIFR